MAVGRACYVGVHNRDTLVDGLRNAVSVHLRQASPARQMQGPKRSHALLRVERCFYTRVSWPCAAPATPRWTGRWSPWFCTSTAPRWLQASRPLLSWFSNMAKCPGAGAAVALAPRFSVATFGLKPAAKATDGHGKASSGFTQVGTATERRNSASGLWSIPCVHRGITERRRDCAAASRVCACAETLYHAADCNDDGQTPHPSMCGRPRGCA
jgi:hypothetical protein